MTDDGGFSDWLTYELEIRVETVGPSKTARVFADGVEVGRATFPAGDHLECGLFIKDSEGEHWYPTGWTV